MCLAIYKPPSAVIPEEHLTAGWQGNNDGAGFAYIKKGKVVIEKGFLKLQEFLTAYKKASEKYPDSPFLIHFRIASMGEKGAENTHPWAFKGGALIHNGTISGTGATWNKGLSDTGLFTKKLDGVITHAMLADNAAKWDAALGSNKVCFLFDDGKFHIINMTLGQWNEGVWYSNGSYKTYQRARTQTTVVPDSRLFGPHDNWRSRMGYD